MHALHTTIKLCEWEEASGGLTRAEWDEVGEEVDAEVQDVLKLDDEDIGELAELKCLRSRNNSVLHIRETAALSSPALSIKA